MEIKINKEIRDYTENIYFGLSLRQFFFSILACISAIFWYFIFRPFFSIEVLSWVCIISALPFAFLGFFKYNGMSAERFIYAYIKSEILTPRYLVFKSKNNYYELIKDRLEACSENNK